MSGWSSVRPEGRSRHYFRDNYYPVKSSRGAAVGAFGSFFSFGFSYFRLALVTLTWKDGKKSQYSVVRKVNNSNIR